MSERVYLYGWGRRRHLPLRNEVDSDGYEMALCGAPGQRLDALAARRAHFYGNPERFLARKQAEPVCKTCERFATEAES